MVDVKGLFSSKTVWGGLIAVLAPIVGHFFHVSVTDVDIQGVGDIVSSVVTAFGGLMAIVGRVLATKAIG